MILASINVVLPLVRPLSITLQIRALSHVHKVPIKVYQADSPLLCIGEEYPSDRALHISYVCGNCSPHLAYYTCSSHTILPTYWRKHACDLGMRPTHRSVCVGGGLGMRLTQRRKCVFVGDVVSSVFHPLSMITRYCPLCRPGTTITSMVLASTTTH